MTDFPATVNITGFDIRDFLEYLQPSTVKNKYICPCCGGKNLSINPGSGKWNCFNDDSREHRRAITLEILNKSGKEIIKGDRPREEIKPFRPREEIKPFHPRKNIPIPTDYRFTLSQRTEINHPIPKIWDKRKKTIYWYDTDKLVIRFDYVKNGKATKDFRHARCSPDGEIIWGGKVSELGFYNFQNAVNLPAKSIIAFVEGEKCVELCAEIGITALTINVGGKWDEVSDAEKFPEIHQQIKQLKDNKAILILPDHDDTGKHHAINIERLLSLYDIPHQTLTMEQLTADGCFNLEPGFDIGDWIDCIQAEGMSLNSDILETFVEIVNNQVLGEKMEKDFKDDMPQPDKGDFYIPFSVRYYEMLKTAINGRVKFNLIKDQIEFDNERLEIEHAKLWTALNFGIEAKEAGEELTRAIINQIAKENEYNPIQEYLLEVERKGEFANIDNLAALFFGNSDPLANIYVKRFLISAVARALNPGVKVDTVPILISPEQGRFKSTFWKVLTGEKYFCDTMGDASDKDSLLLLHSHWVLEWAEVDCIFKKKDVSRVKSFLSHQFDDYRPPYGRTNIRKYRHSVIVGSANETELLNDPSGSRRFWPIEVFKEINLKLLTEMRDAIWASATKAYKAGEQWWLSFTEQKLAEVTNEKFQSLDPWCVVLKNFIEGDRWSGEEFIPSPYLWEAVQPDTTKQDKALTMRVAHCMGQMGWKKTRRKKEGQRIYGYSKQPDLDNLSNQVRHTETIDTQGGSRPARPTTPTFDYREIETENKETAIYIKECLNSVGKVRQVRTHYTETDFQPCLTSETEGGRLGNNQGDIESGLILIRGFLTGEFGRDSINSETLKALMAVFDQPIKEQIWGQLTPTERKVLSVIGKYSITEGAEIMVKGQLVRVDRVDFDKGIFDAIAPLSNEFYSFSFGDLEK